MAAAGISALRRPTGGMRVAELAAAASVSPDTIRYYERAGLLPEPARTSGGYRCYGPEALERLQFIKGCQRLGLRLRDVGELLQVRDTGDCPCEPAATLLDRRMQQIDAEIARLVALRDEMATMIESLPGADCRPPEPATTWCAPRGGERDD